MSNKQNEEINEAIAEAKPVTPEEEKTLVASENKINTVAAMYQNAVNVGTENVTQEDLNTPILKIIQSNTQGIINKKEGCFYRSDTNEQLESVKVNLVFVSTKEVENYNKTAIEKVKVYFGFYAGTNEPFKMFIRGWSLGGHRAFQTEVARYKKLFGVPMLALTVNFKTELQAGTIAETGKSYSTHKIVMEVEKDKEGVPMVEMEAGRIVFLVEAAQRCAAMVETVTPTDEEQNA